MAEDGPVAPEIIEKLQAAAGGQTEISPGERDHSRPAFSLGAAAARPCIGRVTRPCVESAQMQTFNHMTEVQVIDASLDDTIQAALFEPSAVRMRFASSESMSTPIFSSKGCILCDLGC